MRGGGGGTRGGLFFLRCRRRNYQETGGFGEKECEIERERERERDTVYRVSYNNTGSSMMPASL